MSINLKSEEFWTDVVSKQVVEPFLLISRGSDPDVMLKDWKEYMAQYLSKQSSNRKGVRTLNTTTKRRTAYQRFFSETSSRLKQSNPGITFRDISKKASEIWNAMPQDKKKDYALDQSSLQMVIENPQEANLESSLNACTIDTLAKICKERGISKRGNKDAIIQRILSTQMSAMPDNPILSETPVRESSSDNLFMKEEDDAFSVLENMHKTGMFTKGEPIRKREHQLINRIMIVPRTVTATSHPPSTPIITAILDETIRDEHIIPSSLCQPCGSSVLEDSNMDASCPEKEMDADDIVELASTNDTDDGNDSDNDEDDTGEHDDDEITSIISEEHGDNILENDDYDFD